MKFHRFVAACTSLSLLCSWCLTAAVGGGHTPPSPPPCTADGVCLPARHWGIVQPKWRQWPGTSTAADSTPTPATDPLGPLVQPPPIDEDREAPPQIQAIEPEVESSGGASGFELPPMPEFETPSPDQGGSAPPPAAPPTGQGNPVPNTPGPLDLPPLPFGDPLPSLTPPQQIQQSRVPPPARQQSTQVAGVNRDNAPPTMPFAIQQAVGNGVSQASFAPPIQMMHGRSVETRAVAPAVGALPVGENSPPALPAIFYQNK